MKRISAVLLVIVLLFGMDLSVSAADIQGLSARTSVYCTSASMTDHRDLFKEAEASGLTSSLSRIQTAVILQKMCLGEIRYEQPLDISDLNSSSTFSSAAYWAVNNGLMKLYDGQFLPGNPVSREALCLALQGCLTIVKGNLPVLNSRFQFYDGPSMYPREREAAALMQQAGVLIEEKDGFFYPFNPVSVLEAEQIILRFLGGLTDIYRSVPVSTVPESEPVDDAWFDDACFIGHSQVVGMERYFELENPDYYAVIGHTAQDVLDFPYYNMPTGRMGTLKKSLENGRYGKVYIMLGINDCSDREDRINEFKAPMRKILDIVCETQPDATIYILSVAPVGRYTRMNIIYNPDNVILYSQALKDLAREYDAEYLDLFRLMSDSEGYLLSNFDAGDGIHFIGSEYAVIKDFLKCRTVS